MRCVIARFPFDLTKSGVLESMKGIKPEPVTGGEGGPWFSRPANRERHRPGA